MTDQPTRTYTPPIRTYVGDDAFISAELDRDSEYSTDLRIRGAKHNTVTTLHLSPAAVRDLRDTLTRCLVSLESEAIEAAGLEAEAPVTDDDTCDICGTGRSSHLGASLFTKRAVTK
jgi:hypothetical protein